MRRRVLRRRRLGSAALATLLAAALAAPATAAAARAIAITPSPTGSGYWVATSDGRLTAYGDAAPVESVLPIPHLAAIAASPDGTGVWMAGADGTLSAAGTATLHEPAPGTETAAPVTAIAAATGLDGVWVLHADGIVDAYGEALPLAPGQRSPSPFVGIASTPSGAGYWLVTADGTVIAAGDAPQLVAPATAAAAGAAVAGIAAAADGRGYWLARADGGVTAVGSAAPLTDFALGGTSSPVTAIAAHPSASGVWLLHGDGTLLALGDVLDLSDAEAAAIPPVYMPIYRAAADNWDVSPYLLASMHLQETVFSRIRLPGVRSGRNRAGCCAGPMQFSIRPTRTHRLGTWGQYRNAYREVADLRPLEYPLHADLLTACRGRHPCVYDDFDSIAAAAAYLDDLGAGPGLATAAVRRAACRYGGVCWRAPSQQTCRRLPARVASARDYACIVIRRAQAWAAERRIP